MNEFKVQPKKLLFDEDTTQLSSCKVGEIKLSCKFWSLNSFKSDVIIFTKAVCVIIIRLLSSILIIFTTTPGGV